MEGIVCRYVKQVTLAVPLDKLHALKPLHEHPCARARASAAPILSGLSAASGPAMARPMATSSRVKPISVKRRTSVSYGSCPKGGGGVIERLEAVPAAGGLRSCGLLRLMAEQRKHARGAFRARLHRPKQNQAARTPFLPTCTAPAPLLPAPPSTLLLAPAFSSAISLRSSSKSSGWLLPGAGWPGGGGGAAPPAAGPPSPGGCEGAFTCRQRAAKAMGSSP